MLMKRRTEILAILAGATLAALLFAGCYTRVATMRDERDADRDQYSYQGSTNDTGYAGADSGDYASGEQSPYYDDDSWNYSHPRVGFSYYYPSYYWPSYAFSAAYGDPWYFDSYWAYDPWWCGTPYVAYPVYRPYHFYGFGYYPYGYGYGYGYGHGGRPIRTVTRNFGSTRAGNGRASTVNTRSPAPTVDRSGLQPNASGLEAASRRPAAPSAGSVRPSPSQTGNSGRSPARVNNTNRVSRVPMVRPDRSRTAASREARIQYRNSARAMRNSAGVPQRRAGGEPRNYSMPRGGAPHSAPSPRISSSPPQSRGGGSQPSGGSRGGGSQPSGGSRGGSPRGGRP